MGSFERYLRSGVAWPIVAGMSAGGRFPGECERYRAFEYAQVGPSGRDPDLGMILSDDGASLIQRLPGWQTA